MRPPEAASARLPHFIQTGDSPIFIGQGTGTLNCRCGQSVLVRGYDPSNFLAIDLRCGRCGAVTTTPGLSGLDSAPAMVRPVDRTAAAPPEGTTIPAGYVLAGRDELDRLMALHKPRGPASDAASITNALLDSIGADYDRLTGGLLNTHLAEVAAAEAAKPLTGLRRHKLAWAIHTLRTGIQAQDWNCTVTPATPVATTLALAFRYFTDCWSHHPLFPGMVAAAADTGFSLHGLALFATAKCLSDSGNRVAFVPPRDGSDRVRHFVLAMGSDKPLTCVVDVFDAYEWPSTRAWEFPALRAAVLERLAASMGRINQKNPGMIVLSPGAIWEDLEQPLVDAIIATFRSHGRRYRHVSAMSVILAKIKPTTDREVVRFGYSFYPMANPRHTTLDVQVADGNRPTG